MLHARRVERSADFSAGFLRRALTLAGTRERLSLPDHVFVPRQTDITVQTATGAMSFTGTEREVTVRNFVAAHLPPNLYNPGLKIVVLELNDFQRFQVALGHLNSVEKPAAEGAMYAPFQLWERGRETYANVIRGQQDYLPDFMRVIIASANSGRDVLAHEILHDLYFASLDADARRKFEGIVYRGFTQGKRALDQGGQLDPIYQYYFAVQRARWKDLPELETHVAAREYLNGDGENDPQFKSFAMEVFAFAGTVALGFPQKEEGEIDPAVWQFFRKMGVRPPGRIARALQKIVLRSRV